MLDGPTGEIGASVCVDTLLVVRVVVTAATAAVAVAATATLARMSVVVRAGSGGTSYDDGVCELTKNVCDARRVTRLRYTGPTD